MTVVVAGLVFLAAALAVYGALDIAFADDRRVSRRLKDMTDYERAQARDAEPLLKPFAERVIKPIGATLARLVRGFYPVTYRDSLAKRLLQAGDPIQMSPDGFLATQIAFLAGASLFALALGLLGGWKVGSTLFLALLAGIIAFAVPDLWLRSKRSKRKGEIIRSLPDMLDMLTISVQAGLGFDAALAKLVRNTDNALAQEFGRMLQEVQAGASRKEALRHLAERTDVSELSTFVASIIQADMFGVSIATVLRTQAAEMRLKRRQHAEEEAQRAPVKMVIPLVLCILPATMIVIMGPAAIRITGLFAG